MSKMFRNIVLTALFLAFVVIVLGAYVRLSDAGLGCPDWPGCYGKLLGVPSSDVEIHQANTNFDRAVEIGKAWKEMVHRYFAGTLGILIFIISLYLVRKDDDGNRHIFSGIVLTSLLIFQALLGMWTVTLQLKPLIVMGHLLGGFALFNLIAWQWLRTKTFNIQLYVKDKSSLSLLAALTIFIAVCQIALGGWVSSNYAALACTDFPLCQQSLWPDMDFKNGFILWRGLGVDYEFGILDHPARVAIHYTHRIGALVAAGIIIYYVMQLWARSDTASRSLNTIGVIILGLLIAQISLGISNVYFKLPLQVAVAHNGVALLLLFSLVSSLYMIRSAQSFK